MSNVFVVDTNFKQLNPIHPGSARLLLSSGRAAVYRHYPFTIVLKVAVEAPIEPLRVKIDPGSKTTGIAVVNDATGEVVFAAELTHRGQTIKASLDARRSLRRSRRNRKTRYRKARWSNRCNKKERWLPPSRISRIANVTTWVGRLMRVCHITALSMELVKFDLQAMENAEISGVEYQQGTLQGYEAREYLLQKWERSCSYCSKTDMPLQIEHIHPRANGGSNRIANLCLACEQCNKAKGTKDIKDFLAKKPDLLRKILAQAKAPLKDATAVNATRWELFRWLQSLGLPIECGSGGLTKYNRSRRHLPKTHWLDAANVGKSTPEILRVKHVHPLVIIATGHGSRQMCRMSKFGFPRTGAKRHKRVQGFMTGDLVRAVVASGKKVGTYVGRVAVRATGFFNITTFMGTIEGVSYKYCSTIHHCDGYAYHHRKGGGIPPTTEPVGILPQKS